MKHAIVTLVILLSALNHVSAQPGLFARERIREFRREAAEELKLTEDQQLKIERLRIDLEKKQSALHARIRASRLDMKEALLAEKPDKAILEKGIRAANDLQLQMKLNRLEHEFSVYAVLTPEQQKLWKRHMLSRGNRPHGPAMRGWLGPRGQRGQERGDGPRWMDDESD